MKLDRRGFLKFVVGGAIGTLATPLPWEMIDESAKFTDLWAPEPAKGLSSFVNTTCRLCPGGCGITLRLVEDNSGRDYWRGWHHKEFFRRKIPAVPLRAVKIEGNPDHPVNRGGICPLGAAGLQLLYGVNRIRTPLKRTNSKKEKEPVWKEISWEEALDIVTAKLRKMREAGTPHNVACILDSKSGLIPQLVDRFFRAYGSPNVITMPSQEDVEAIGLSLMQGTNGHLAYDLENSKCILSFGTALFDGWGAPVHNMRLFAKWQERRNQTLVQIEPNCSITASKANRWIAVRPGTEAALALGMANVIVKEGLYDAPSVARFRGFSSFQALLKQDYDISKVSKLTGVPESTIANTARQFAVTRPSVAIYGRGQGVMSGSLAEFMSVYSLNALVGNIGQRGGAVMQREIPFKAWPSLVTDAVARQGLAEPRVDGSESEDISMAHNLPGSFKYGGVEALFVHEANPCYAMPRADKFKEAMAEVPFVVALSTYMNETAQMSDVVLPLASYLERVEDVPSPKRVPGAVLSLTRTVLANVPEARHPGDIYLTIARSLGGSVRESLPWDSFEALLKDKVKGIFASKRGRIGDKTVAAFGSADEVWDALYAGKCWYDEPDFSRVNFNFAPPDKLSGFEPLICLEDRQDYPMLLVAYEEINIAHRRAVNTLPYLTKNINDTVLQKKDLLVRVNPGTAGRLRLSEGDRAAIQCPNGRLLVRVHLDVGTMPNVIGIPLGLGHSADDPFLAGKGVNAYEVLEPVVDGATGLAVWWGTKAKLIKI